MFEEYLQDSYEFLVIARKESDDRDSRRYYRGSVFYAAGAIEAFLNYVADSFAKAHSLPPHEIAYLNDKNLVFSAEKGKLIEKVEFHRLEDKLKLLLRRFVPQFDFKSTTWSNVMEFKHFRDSLVHPRQTEDEIKDIEYDKKVRSGISAIIEIMNHISRGIFKRPLRKQLLDLIPE
ncbi:MAG TPA: hypothetical protein VJ246_01520 [Patescibacteria group bacterium]|nr:hypothetical protein [Patescibacteria group bacterium]